MQREKDVTEPFKNFRDLGGFQTVGGGYVPRGRYFRSGMPESLGEAQINFLRQNGIRTVLDFRVDEEQIRSGWYRKENLCLDYIRIPYYDREIIAWIRTMDVTEEYDWPRIYSGVLENGREWMRRVFTALALSEQGVLFYCASGKDRTGIIAAVLLELLGAPDLWIYTDYALTWYCLEHNGSNFYRTDPWTMREFLHILRERYGGAAEYLRQSGVPENLVLRIKNKALAAGASERENES